MAGNLMTRRDFLTGLAAAVAMPVVGVPMLEDVAFDDLEPNMYYVLQGGPYKDTGGDGGPYYYMGSLLIHDFALLAAHPDFEERLDRIASKGFYLSVSTYFGQPYRSCGRIHLTKSWIKEFYRRHMHDTDEDWHRRYTEWHDALRASGWRPEYDRMSREELAAIGWKGLDTYRKVG